jgi:hypothetical protein
MIDFWWALYSHCEAPGGKEDISPILGALLDEVVTPLVKAPMFITRICSFLQGSVTFLDEDAEFRVHVWFDLPETHPDFPHADRGMACIVQPVSPEGLYGPVEGQVAWLGEVLPSNRPAPDPRDWIAVMIADQGYISIPETQWSLPYSPRQVDQLMAGMLQRHLSGMTSRRILEAERDANG